MERDIKIEFDRKNMQRMLAMRMNKESKEYNNLQDDDLLLLCLQVTLKPYAVKNVKLI